MTAIRNLRTKGGVACISGPCSYLVQQAGTWVSHCSLPSNRVPPQPGWPSGFEPSLDPYNQGCASHTKGVVAASIAEIKEKPDAAAG